MLVLISVSSLVTGTVLSCLLDRFPKQSVMLERCSGIMLVTGLAVIGGALPLFR